jgi:hypothetical protein
VDGRFVARRLLVEVDSSGSSNELVPAADSVNPVPPSRLHNSQLFSIASTRPIPVAFYILFLCLKNHYEIEVTLSAWQRSERGQNNMSRASKLTLLASSAFAVGTIVFVHYAQQSEKAVRYPLTYLPELPPGYRSSEEKLRLILC